MSVRISEEVTMFGVAMKIPGFYYNRMKMHPNKIPTTSPPTVCELGLYIGDGGTQAMDKVNGIKRLAKFKKEISNFAEKVG
ncbi:hypothetical protein YC2023_115766 [Brassica napus]